MLLKIDEDYLIRILQTLVQIDSRNPSLSPDSEGEAAIGAFVSKEMRALGLEVTVHTLAPNRVNVVGNLRGVGNGRSLMLNAHMDTVGVEGMAEPFSGEIREGKLYGRGSQDMKGSLAAMLAAAKALVDAKVQLAGDLLLTAVCDEEYISIGTDDIVKHYHPDAAIVTEPTGMQLCRAHRGFVWYEVETVGRAAHGSRYQEGIDANMHMGRVLGKLDQLEQALRQRPGHPLTGPPSLHAAMIKGGTAVSVYADRCKLKIERRTVPGETVAQVTQEIQQLLDELAAADPTFNASLKIDFPRAYFVVDEAAPIVQTVDAALTNRQGKQTSHVGVSFWTDAAILAEAGIDTVLLGPIGHGLHSAEEWVEIESLVDLAAVLGETAVNFCN